MSTLTGFSNLLVVSPDPTCPGGLAINNNFRAVSTHVDTTDPTTSDNSSLGYRNGSRWYNSSTTAEWICLNSTVGAAVWTAIASANYAWTLDNQPAKTAVNPATGDQTTTFGYGTTLATSGVARADLPVTATYPDTSTIDWNDLTTDQWADMTVEGWARLPVTEINDVTSKSYNRLSEEQTFQDQRGTVLTFVRDKLGRGTNDCVTTVGVNTDNAVLQIARTFEVRGMVSGVTSFDTATVGAGSTHIVNDVSLTYNTFAQLYREYQEHSGQVNTSTTPFVQYDYDTGSATTNEIRQNQLTYPNLRTIGYNFGTSGGMDDLLNRVQTIQDTTSGTTDLATYDYLGIRTPVRITYPQPGVWLDLWGGTSGVFAGLDLFNRIIDQRWQNNITTSPVDIDRYKYGYDLNSNRIWKNNVVGTAAVTAGLDEYYTMDHLNRLTDMQRGVLNGTNTGITGTPSREMAYGLDATGNWGTYLTKTIGTTDLNQGRGSNAVNAITFITASGGTPLWVTPAYDAAGNMTTMPQPGTPTSAFTTVYDAWNRMTSISTGGSPVGQYQYDGRRRRITTAAMHTRHFYFTDAWQDLEQRVGTASTMDQQHVWGIRYIDELVCRDDSTPQRLYVCQDAIFDVTALIGAAGGAPQQYFVYDPYGTSIIFSGIWGAGVDSYAWGRRFGGQQWDSETQIYLARARFFLSALGIFTTRDPDNISDTDLNRYAYCDSNPTVATDPSGLAKVPQLPDELWNLIKNINIHDATRCDPSDSCPTLFTKTAIWYQVLFVRTVKSIFYASIGYTGPHGTADQDVANAISNCIRLMGPPKNCIEPPTCPPVPIPPPIPPPVSPPITPPVSPFVPVPPGVPVPVPARPRAVPPRRRGWAPPYAPPPVPVPDGPPPQGHWYIDPDTGKRVLVVGGVIFVGWAAYVTAAALAAAIVAAAPVGA